MNSTVKTVIFWLVIVLSAFLLWQVVRTGSTGQKEKTLNFSDFQTSVDQGNVKDVVVTAQEVRGHFKDGSAFRTTAPANYSDMYKEFRDKGVSYEVKDVTNGSWPLQLLGTWAPLILLAAPPRCITTVPRATWRRPGRRRCIQWRCLGARRGVSSR